MDDDWLEERLNNYGQRYRIKRLLYQGRSPFQEIKVVETTDWGVMLLLDGAVQTTERDEFVYHEMLVHPSLLLHPSPQRVLIIGGGDGGVLRHCLQHPIKEAYMVEIDEEVMEICQQYLPSIGGAFKDERAKVFIEDGFTFLENSNIKFDVIIVDSTDPVGEAKKLFSKRFYQLAHDNLGDDGILVTQSGSLFYQPELLREVYHEISTVFPHIAVIMMTVPTYPGVVWTATLGSKLYDPFQLTPDEWLKRANERKLSPKYWTPYLQFLPKDFPLLQRILRGGLPFAP